MGIGECNVQVGYQLCIWSGTEGNHLKLWPIWSAAPSRRLLRSGQQCSLRTYLLNYLVTYLLTYSMEQSPS
jgi:hypothetical protein